MRIFNRGVLIASSSLIAVLFSNAAAAQTHTPPQPNGAQAEPGQEPPTTDREIVVTALKRGAQTLTGTPAAVSVISGTSIEDAGARSLQDVIQLTPGVTISPAAVAGATSISIRGVNTTFGAATVGFYLDDLPFSLINVNWLPDPSVYDLNRVEILRGPQGSLYGAGASGGVVLVRTQDPVLNRLEGKAEGRISGTDGGGTNYMVGGALNLPIITDRVALRLAASYNDDSGWLDAPILGAKGKHYNSERRLNVRGKLRVVPVDALVVQLQASVSRIDAYGTSSADDNGIWFGLPADAQVDYEQYGAIVSYDFSKVRISSTSSLLHWKNVSDAGLNVTVPSKYDSDTFAQEVRLNSTGTGSFSWVVGGFYRKSSFDSFQDASALGLPVNIDEHIKNEQVTAYGEGSLSLLDRALDLTAGASYFHDRTENFSIFPIFSPLPINNTTSTDRFSPKVSIAYHPTQNSTIYASYAQGFRPGTLDFVFSTFFARFTIPTITGIVAAEDLNSYELGAKADLLDNKIHLEGAFFLNDINNLQQSASVVVPGTSTSAVTVLNAGNARTSGFEWLIGIRPSQTLTINFSGSYTDTKIKQDFFAPGANPATATPLFFKGSPLNQVPKWQVALTASHKHNWGTLEGAASVSFQYASKRPLTILSGPSQFGQDNIRVDARYELSRDNWTVFVFGENLTNEDRAVAPSVYTATIGLFGFPQSGITASRLRPRTFGLGVRAKF